MAEVTFREANKRYRRLFWPVMIFYTVFCFAGSFLIKGMDDPPKWISAIVALVTAAPILGVFWLLGRFVRETDEYTRKIQTEAMLSGGAIVLSFAVIWSFFDLYDVIPGMEKFPAMVFVGPGFFFFYGLSIVAGNLRRGDKLADAFKGDPTCMGLSLGADKDPK
jgi:cytochrome bd-type quinol oxidase subunit 2